MAICQCYGEGRQAGRDLHLHIDGAGLDAFKGDGCDVLDHVLTLMRAMVAETGDNGKNI